MKDCGVGNSTYYPKKSWEVGWGDVVFMIVVTGGVFLIYLMGCCIYVYIRAFIRRFILKMPDWGNF